MSTPAKTPAKSKANGSMSARKRTVSRDLRSASPVKQPAPVAAKPKAAPRKRKTKKDAADADEVDVDAEELLEMAEEVAEAAAEEAAALEAIALTTNAEVNGVESEEPLNENTVRVSVTEDVVPGDDDTETTRTTVKVEMPANAPDLALPQDTEGVVAVAGEIIKDAKELKDKEAAGSSESKKASSSRKRKAESLDEESVELKGPEEIVQVVAEGDASTLAEGEVVMHGRAAKRTRVMVPAEEYRREKVKRRALMGLSGALAVGVMLPFISNLF